MKQKLVEQRKKGDNIENNLNNTAETTHIETTLK